MIDQDIRFPAVGRQEQKADIERIIAAIIATTRREWLSRGCEPLAQDRSDGNWNRLAHPMIRFAFDPKRINLWRARVDRQAPLPSARQLARLDGAPLDAHQNQSGHEWIRPLKLP